MFDAILSMGQPASLGLAFTSGMLLAALAAATVVRNQRARLSRDVQRAKRSLRSTQEQLDQARKSAEALEEEVQGWRRRSALGGGVRSASRAVPVSPSPQAQDWVISALLDGDRARGFSPDAFADTQIQLGHAH